MRERPSISQMADFQDKFSRQHTGDAPEPTKPYRGWGFDAACGGCLIAFMIGAFVVAGFAPEILCALGWSECL